MSSIVSNNTNVVLLSDTSTNVVSYVREAYTPISVGVQGPQGIPGASTALIYLIAGIPLGGNRVVSTNSAGHLVYPDMENHFQTLLGITTGASLQGDISEVQICGLMTEPSWNWNLVDPIFISSNGTLTQNPEEVGFLCVIAYPILSNKIFIDKQAPIWR